MKYEFKVGDYVETNIGKTGYIDMLEDSEDGCDISVIYLDGETNRYQCDSWYIMFKGWPYTYGNLFRRIGKYDFTQTTKTERRNKIAPLEKNTKHGIFFYDSENMGLKINEIIDYINKNECEK